MEFIIALTTTIILLVGRYINQLEFIIISLEKKNYKVLCTFRTERIYG